MLTQLPHKTDEELRTIYSMWEAGLLRASDGVPWATPQECRSWPGVGDPTGQVFRKHAYMAYVELEE